MGNFKNDDYVDVAERIREFKSLYPDGTLQPADPLNPHHLERIGDETIIVYVAAAYRTPNDERPGIGCASEPYPGKTNFTRGSELQNAETSAWGRAIVALGIPTKRIASTEEARNRKAEQGEEARIREDAQRERAATKPAPENNGDAKLLSGAAQQRLGEIILSRGRTVGGVLAAAQKRGIGSGLLETLTVGAAKQIAEAMKGLPEATPDPTPEATPEPPAPAAATETQAEPAAPQEAPVAQDEANEPDEDERRFLDETAKPADGGHDPWGTVHKEGTITKDPGLLKTVALRCRDLEDLGVTEAQWREFMWIEESVTSRQELSRAAASRMLARLAAGWCPSG